MSPPVKRSAATFHLANDPTVIVSERLGDSGRTNSAIAHVLINHEIWEVQQRRTIPPHQ